MTLINTILQYLMVVYIYVVKDLQCNIVHTNMYKYTNFLITIIINYLLTIIKLLWPKLYTISQPKNSIRWQSFIYIYICLLFYKKQHVYITCTYTIGQQKYYHSQDLRMLIGRKELYVASSRVLNRFLSRRWSLIK